MGVVALVVAGVVRVGAQDAEAGAGHGGQGVAVDQLVLAVAEEGEVVVGQPAQQLAGLLHLGRAQVGGGGLVGEAVRDAQRGVAHLLPVLDRLADVGQDAQQVGGDLLEVGAVGLAVDLDVDPGLGERVVRQLAVDLGRQDLDEPAGDVAADEDLRVDHDVDAAALAGQLVGDRVDEEGHVVGDDLDDGVAAGPAVLLDRRGVDAHVRRALRTLLRQAVVGEGGAEDVDRVPAGQVLGRGVQVVALEVLEHGVAVRALARTVRPRRKSPPTGLCSATRAALSSSSALASSSLVCMSSDSWPRAVARHRWKEGHNASVTCVRRRRRHARMRDARVVVGR